LASSPAPDFLRPARVVQPWALAGCGLLVLAAIGSTLIAAQMHARQAEAAQAVARADRALRAGMSAAAARPAGSRAAAAPATRGTQHDWPRDWLAIEAATPAGVQWLALERKPGQTLRLEGQADARSGSEPAVAAAQALQASGRFGAVHLSQLELNAPAGDARPFMRFVLEARQ
jgi:hypothetical protein